MWRPPRWAQTATCPVKFLMTASIVSCPMRRVSATMFAFSSAIVLGFDEYTLSFRWPQRKKSGGVRSGEWGDHSIGHLRLMIRCPKWAWSQSSVLLAVCGVAPSCWSHWAPLQSLFLPRILKESFSNFILTFIAVKHSASLFKGTVKRLPYVSILYKKINKRQ